MLLAKSGEVGPAEDCNTAVADGPGLSIKLPSATRVEANVG